MIPNDPIHQGWSPPHPSFSDSIISQKMFDKLSDSFSKEFKNGFASIELCQFWIRLISSFFVWRGLFSWVGNALFYSMHD